jgi:hypothetical protein
MEQATNQPRFLIFVESETEFILKVAGAQIEFFKNESRSLGAWQGRKTASSGHWIHVISFRLSDTVPLLSRSSRS